MPDYWIVPFRDGTALQTTEHCKSVQVSLRLMQQVISNKCAAVNHYAPRKDAKNVGRQDTAQHSYSSFKNVTSSDFG